MFLGLSKDGRWLLLIHQIPPKPAYFRVKIWRKLGSVGAVAIKSSVYALPKTDACHESLQWIAKEIAHGGGDATICEAHFVEGLADSQIESMFNAARSEAYRELSEEVRRVSKSGLPRGKLKDGARKTVETELVTLKRRFAEIAAIDFFGATGREATEGLIAEIESKLLDAEPGTARIGKTSLRKEELLGRQWVTRRGIHVDRIASAWLIRRFIDPEARFSYVDGKTHVPRKGELRFDMFQAEFTHEGELCTFEVLVEKTNLTADQSLVQLGQIIHNIDIRDGKYQRGDVEGIEQVINGICMANKEDDDRLKAGSTLFDALYEYFKRKRP